MNNLQYSQIGLTLTEGEESLRLVAYQDSKGVWTNGWGHTGPDVHPGQVITRDQAITWLINDSYRAASAVNRLVSVPLNQHQFDGLVDFVFNEGEGHFAGSTLLLRLNAGDYAGAAAHFADWTLAAGKRLGGLVRRRADETALFLEAA